MITDPIADMLTRIRNAQLVGKPSVLVPYSKMKLEIAKILAREKYIGGFSVKKNNIMIDLIYHDGVPAISYVVRVSKPGRRVYVKKDRIPWVKGGYGLAILSTSQGLMTDKESRKKKIGGELICKIW